MDTPLRHIDNGLKQRRQLSLVDDLPHVFGEDGVFSGRRRNFGDPVPTPVEAEVMLPPQVKRKTAGAHHRQSP
ncbi:MAG: hypothetical protein Q8O25_06750 [Sulfurisoma sp.]|nr:hypothetical protein [Sulfurisoma sp.]